MKLFTAALAIGVILFAGSVHAQPPMPGIYKCISTPAKEGVMRDVRYSFLLHITNQDMYVKSDSAWALTGEPVHMLDRILRTVKTYRHWEWSETDIHFNEGDNVAGLVIDRLDGSWILIFEGPNGYAWSVSGQCEQAPNKLL